MENSTLVLTALLRLNEELLNDDCFAGYNDDPEGTARLLDDLWGLVPTVAFDASAEDLIDAWYDQAFAQMNAFCAG